MGASKSFIKNAVGILIVVAVCFVAVTIYKKGNDSINSSMKDYDELINQFNTAKLEDYQNAKVLGSQIVELLKGLEEDMEVTIEVRNGYSTTTGQKYTYDDINKKDSTILLDIADKTKQQQYINPRAFFVGSVQYDDNHEISSVIFQQQ